MNELGDGDARTSARLASTHAGSTDGSVNVRIGLARVIAIQRDAIPVIAYAFGMPDNVAEASVENQSEMM